MLADGITEAPVSRRNRSPASIVTYRRVARDHPLKTGDRTMTATRRWVLSSPDCRIAVDVDTETGLPVLLSSVADSTLRSPLSMTVSADIGGTEVRGWRGGLSYEGVRVETSLRATGAPSRVHRGTHDDYAVPITLGPLKGSLRYSLYPSAPYLEVAIELTSDTEIVVRNVRAVVDIAGDPSEQLLHIPGGTVHRGVTVQEVGVEPLGISPLGGLRGSSAVIGIETHGETVTLWPTQVSEISDITLHRRDDGLRVDIATNLAAVVDPAAAVEISLLTLDLQRIGLEGLGRQWPDWAARLGLTSPPVKPAWARAACIYEVQIGTSRFWGGHTYSPYSTVAEVTDDLERIASLGFTVIQLMPRQPYPSYNVHDYADITTSYGDEQELIALVTRAHALGMRVILDVLLHGVLDNEAVDSALAGIAAGPLADRLDQVTGDSFGSDIADQTNYQIAWSRHIHDFAEDWKGGSPLRTPLESEHPDWFLRDSSGAVSGVYTKAFDARNEEWQRYFRSAMLTLIDTLDIDGFRFDAPTYNNTANWSTWSRARASLSALGCVSLFVDLRNDIKNAYPEALMYTEPSGHLLRRSMDVNYNYDEQWLVTALMTPQDVNQRGVTTAQQLMHWMEDRDAFLPVGSRTAHHIDSHDTFWWPQWGSKWRREQFGIDAVRALTVTFMALDGPYMMFTGGEQGVERELQLMGGLRQSDPELWTTPAAFVHDADDSGDLFIVRRRTRSASLTIVVNLSRSTARTIPASVMSDGDVEAELALAHDQIGPLGYVVIASRQQ